MAGPDKQFDRNATLKKALEVFWAKGFAATSMQELVSKMGINRASMYQTYGNKQALYIAAIDQYIENTLAHVRQELDSPGLPLDKLHKLLRQFVIGSIKNNMSGCLVNNAAVELGPYDKDIAKKARFFWGEFESMFNELLKQAVEKGEIKRDIDTAKYALLINTTLQGLMVKTKSNTPKKEILGSLDTLFSLVKG